MITKILKHFKTQLDSRGNSGFTLIEVLVAILIGTIVMGMAIAILGTTNSASLRVLSKSEAQQNTRSAVVNVLENLSNAESLDLCRVGVNKDIQSAINAFPALRSNLITDANCKETSSSGNVIVLAQPNRLCYFNKNKDVNLTPKVECITRGGNAAVSQPTAESNYISTDFSSCIRHVNTGSVETVVYTFSCDSNDPSSSGLNWPERYSAPTSWRTLADLSVQSTAPITIEPLFEYTLDSSAGLSAAYPSVINRVFQPDLDKTIAVKLDLRIEYETKNNSNPIEVYRFNQTVVLRGSKLAQQENFNG